MDIIAAKLGANMAISELAASGQIGYETKTETVVYPKTKLEYQIIPDKPFNFTGMLSDLANDFLFIMEAGKTYVVDLGGVKYTCVATPFEDGSIMFGDMTGTFEDFPFAFAYIPEAYAAEGVVYKDHMGDGTIAIYELTETVTPIDPKYLPFGTLDLSEYRIPNFEETISDVVLQLALMGGGVRVAATSGMEQFWTDVVAKQPAYLLFDVYGPKLRLNVGALFASEDIVNNGEAVLSADGILALYGESLEGNFVLSQHEGSGLKISVKSEQVVFPENAE